jgi:hypothetical protein
MRSKDDDLVQDLSARLTEEIGNLPNDGEDHELRIKIKGRGNKTNINLGSQTFEIRSGKESPPQNSDRAKQCPQCGKCTWRYTQLCMHCDYDLHRHDQIEAEELAEIQKNQHNARLLKIGAACTVAAIGGFSMSSYFPEGLKNWAMGAAAGAGLLALLIIQGTDTKSS